MEKVSKRNSYMNFAGFGLLVLAAAFIALCVISTSEEIQRWYAGYEEMLYKLDMAILSIGTESYIIFIIIALYAIKCFVPVVSVSAICVLTGMVFPTVPALIVNAVGVFFMMTVKYKIGRNYTGGRAMGILAKNEVFRKLFRYRGKGKAWLLFVFRLIPTFPINTISQIYGSMKFDYKKFAIISMLGYAPKLLSYTFIGVYAFDPLSVKFFIPIIVLLVISGVTVLGVNKLINYLEKN
ncbi:MAG: VTT domain-containing protein [Clostridia bacterium]|nr:VTT domain-containing protein [Clostridia bacterium]MBQ6931353.1 VTT domain-containing protein [Clostridia bacterium]